MSYCNKEFVYILSMSEGCGGLSLNKVIVEEISTFIFSLWHGYHRLLLANFTLRTGKKITEKKLKIVVCLERCKVES